MTLTISVIIPVFNEAATVEKIFSKVREANPQCEIVLVDDASADDTRLLLERLAQLPQVIVLSHDVNRGKGAALRLGFERVGGEIVIIQDADLEYDPSDYPRLVEPILRNEADVVFGSRFLPESVSTMPWLTRWANRFITVLFNRVNGQHLTDVETCYKVFRREILRQVSPTLVENRFGIEIELAAKVCRISQARIVERPVHYRARTRHEGKKIGWRDGVRAIWCIVKYR